MLVLGLMYFGICDYWLSRTYKWRDMFVVPQVRIFVVNIFVNIAYRVYYLSDSSKCMYMRCDCVTTQSNLQLKSDAVN